MSDCDALHTDWTDAVARGRTPTPLALKAHLKAVHKTYTGFTESCATHCTDKAGRTSYSWLLEAVRPEIDGVLLDLACGSGPLLDLCHRRFAPEMQLIGVDMSADELDVARRRLPIGRVELYEAQADAMTLIPNASVDVALCHWALTLIDPVMPALQEVKRVLKPGGRFAAIVDGPMELAASYKRVNDLVYGYVKQELPSYGAVDLGDPRVRNWAGVMELMRKAFPNSNIRVEANIVSMDGNPVAVAKEAAGFFYANFVLSNERRRAMLIDLAETLETVQSDMSQSNPVARFSMPINRIVVDLSEA